MRIYNRYLFITPKAQPIATALKLTCLASALWLSGCNQPTDAPPQKTVTLLLPTGPNTDSYSKGGGKGGSASGAQLTVHFSPAGGCTEAIVQEIDAARKSIWMQAYSFTSKPIAAALINAAKRGVKVTAVLDKSNETARYTSATFLANMSIATYIDDKHAIAHNKVMVIDDATVLTGSFNFTAAAEQRNAENSLIIKNAPAIVRAYRDNIFAHIAHSVPYPHNAEVSDISNANNPAGETGDSSDSGVIPGGSHRRRRRRSYANDTTDTTLQ